MKNYQKAEMIAKNLPTGSYAAGCPEQLSEGYYGQCYYPATGERHNCTACEVTK